MIKTEKRLIYVMNIILLFAISMFSARTAYGKELSSYDELVRLLGSDISYVDKNGTTIIEYCPDNTCDTFSMPSSRPPEKLRDFAFIYLYTFSGYIYLEDFKKNIDKLQLEKVLKRNESEFVKKGESISNIDLLVKMSKKYSIKVIFVRYDEMQRNEAEIDIKTNTFK